MRPESSLPAGTVPVRSTAGQQNRIGHSSVWRHGLSHPRKDQSRPPCCERVSPGILIFIPPPLHYGFHRPATVASSAAPVPAALSASAGQWPASLAIRLPSPTARSPSAAAPWCAGTTTTPTLPFPKLPSSSLPVALLPVLAPPTRAIAAARLPPHRAPAWPPRYRNRFAPDAAAAPPSPASAP